MLQQLLHNLQTGKFLFAKTCLEKSYKGHTLLQWKNKCILQGDEWLNHLAKCSTLVSLKSDSLMPKKETLSSKQTLSLWLAQFCIVVQQFCYEIAKKSFIVAFAIH